MKITKKYYSLQDNKTIKQPKKKNNSRGFFHFLHVLLGWILILQFTSQLFNYDCRSIS